MSKATTSVAPTNRECHPERSEGSLSPASQTLRCAQGDTRRQAARSGRPGAYAWAFGRAAAFARSSLRRLVFS